MLKKLTLTITALVILTFAFANLGYAQQGRMMNADCDGPGMMHNRGGHGCCDGPGFGHGSGHGDGFGPGICMFADELELSDQQKDDIHNIRIATHKKLVDYKADLEKAKIEMKELWYDGVPSENQVNKLIDRISDIKTEMKKLQVSAKIKTMNVLTEDQRDELREMRMEKKACGKHHRGCMKDRGCRMHQRLQSD
ncbi:MAG: hypothetical protein GF315_04370 [candidate division Zixibacteria bacterium]|nr:hypothetical protein [candidate division Zixibacteria bacterium]